MRAREGVIEVVRRRGPDGEGPASESGVWPAQVVEEDMTKPGRGCESHSYWQM